MSVRTTTGIAVRQLARLGRVAIVGALCTGPVWANAPPTAQEVKARVEVVSAFVEWLAATNARDFASQSVFYPETMDAFYLWREAPRDEVLAEKRRVFERAQVIDITTEAPQVVVDPSGRKARMWFRKAYTIRGAGVNRKGEVLQELIWAKHDDGWKITSERDLLVIER